MTFLSGSIRQQYSFARVLSRSPSKMQDVLSCPFTSLAHVNESYPFGRSVRCLSTSQILYGENKSLMARFKQMVKDYWYIIIPVEIGTSVVWYGAIFLSLKSGVDLVEILTNIGVSKETLGKLPDAGGDYGYHALTFVCYKVISPIRHALSLAITAGVVSGLQKTRPGFLPTSSYIAKEARETGEDLREKYGDRVAEGREKIDELKNRARETGEDLKERYGEKVAEGRDKIDELKNKAHEKWKKN